MKSQYPKCFLVSQEIRAKSLAAALYCSLLKRPLNATAINNWFGPKDFSRIAPHSPDKVIDSIQRRVAGTCKRPLRVKLTANHHLNIDIYRKGLFTEAWLYISHREYQGSYIHARLKIRER